MRVHHNLARATFDELAGEAARRGYRLTPVAQAATLDRLVPMPADVLAEIHEGLRSIPGLCAEIRGLRERLAVADGAVGVLIASGFDSGLSEMMGDQ